jgi:serine protease inhibitor
MVNRIFYRKLGQSSPEKIQDITEIFDFKNMKDNPAKLNNYIQNATRGNIKNAFKEALDKETIYLLISTLFFKASWKNSFNDSYVCWKITEDKCNDKKAVTGISNFKILNEWYGEYPFLVIEIPLTYLRNETTNVSTIQNYSVLQIWMPEKILKTKEDHLQFLDIMKKKVNKMARMMTEYKMKLTFPKFSISTEYDLKTLLLSYGVESIFKPGKHLGPLFGRDDIPTTLKKANHMVELNVDKNGIEGAGVTTISMEYARTAPIPMLIDRPFYFRIVVKEDGENPTYGDPIFSGRVVDPAF